MSTSVEKSSRLHSSGHCSTPGLGWDAALGSPVGTTLLWVRSSRLDLDAPCAHGPGPPMQGTSPGLCPGGCKTIRGGADPAAKWSEGWPGSHRILGALGTAQWFEAISWCSLGFRVFNLVHHWVLRADSTKVQASPPPCLGHPGLKPSCRCYLQHGAGKLAQDWREKGENIDPKT